jgi:hypothetical protein
MTVRGGACYDWVCQPIRRERFQFVVEAFQLRLIHAGAGAAGTQTSPSTYVERVGSFTNAAAAFWSFSVQSSQCASGAAPCGLRCGHAEGNRAPSRRRDSRATATATSERSR